MKLKNILKEALVLSFLSLMLFSCNDSERDLIDYPSDGKYGVNLLSVESDSISMGNYSLAAVLEKDASLAVKISGDGWFIELGSAQGNWDLGPYVDADYSRTMDAHKTGKIDADIDLEMVSDIVISAFENGASLPSWSDSIHVYYER